MSGLCELCQSLASESAARQLKIPALVEVNLAAEETKSGIAPEDLEGFLELCRQASVEMRGLMTMPPLAHDPEASRPYFRRLRELAERHDLPRLFRWEPVRTTLSPPTKAPLHPGRRDVLWSLARVKRAKSRSRKER